MKTVIVFALGFWVGKSLYKSYQQKVTNDQKNRFRNLLSAEDYDAKEVSRASNYVFES